MLMLNCIRSLFTTKQESYFLVERHAQDLFLTPREGHDSTLIFMHGLGDTADGYYDVFETQNRPIPARMKVVLLTAPSSKVTINAGESMPSWYDIKSFTGSEKDIEQRDVIKNALRVKEAVDYEAGMVGGDYKRVFIGGFSQGACMALHVGLTMKETIGGIIGLSGFLFPFTAAEIDKDTKKEQPIYIAHGKLDDVIPEVLAKKSYKCLFDWGFTNVKYTSIRMDHTIAYNELEEMNAFLTSLI